MKFGYMFSIMICCFWVNQNIAQKQWQEFTPPGQQFKVLVPGTMTNGQKKILTDVGEMRPETWMCEGSGDDPNKLYLVSYVDYPAGTFHPDSTALIEELFQASLETHLKDLSGQLTYQTASNYNQNPGLFYRATYNDNKLVVKSRMLLIGDRFYALQVYTFSEKSLNDGMNKFLESFRIIEKQ